LGGRRLHHQPRADAGRCARLLPDATVPVAVDPLLRLVRCHVPEVRMHAFLLAVALAAATGGAKQPQPAPKHIDIDDDEVVEGSNKNPEGEDVFARKRAHFGTLIKLRENFLPELLKSAE